MQMSLSDSLEIFEKTIILGCNNLYLSSLVLFSFISSDLTGIEIIYFGLYLLTF